MEEKPLPLTLSICASSSSTLEAKRPIFMRPGESGSLKIVAKDAFGNFIHKGGADVVARAATMDEGGDGNCGAIKFLETIDNGDGTYECAYEVDMERAKSLSMADAEERRQL